MKRFLFVWLSLGLCLNAMAQTAGPLPLRPGFVRWYDSTSRTAALDTVLYPGIIQIPGSVAYFGPYVLFVSKRGQVSVSSAVRDRHIVNTIFPANNNSFGWNKAPGCSSVYGDKIVFVHITDGYFQPQRFLLVELSLTQKAFVRYSRSRKPICASYSADGTLIQVETQGQQRTVRSAY